MSKRKITYPDDNMAITSKSKCKVKASSTPEQHSIHSPSRDSDSICDSQSASPIPFLCTQDGAEGNRDVVWNFYTPKSGQNVKSRVRNYSPLARKAKRLTKYNITDKPLTKRKNVRATQNNAQFFQDLVELNQNVNNFIENKPASEDCKMEEMSVSNDDIFDKSDETSPMGGVRLNSPCLRRNLLSSRYNKPDPEPALESDDSMNEFLIKASQMVEINIAKRKQTPKSTTNNDKTKTDAIARNLKIGQDSMDAILNSIKFDSPVNSKHKQGASPHLENDSFDNIIGNLNNTTLDRLTQCPPKMETPNRSYYCASNSIWDVKEMSPSSKFFGRHSSMPESPTVTDLAKPSTSGMAFGRYNSLPHNNQDTSQESSSPNRCSNDEIKRKHLQAREKLLAKRLLPFTNTSFSQGSQVAQNVPQIQHNAAPKRAKFQPKVPTVVNKSTSAITRTNSMPVDMARIISSDITPEHNIKNKNDDIKDLIEKKRQEAMMRLRKRQQTKLP